MSTTNILKLIPEYLKAFAVIIGGLWVYWKFIYQREKEPAANIDIDVRFVGIQNEAWIIEVTSFLSNKSLVRLTYRDFQITVRYLSKGDSIEDGNEKVHYQLSCAKTIDERISGKKRLFANASYINPKQEFKHRYVTFIPIDASVICVQCKFIFGRKNLKTNSQKIFRVPTDVNELKD